MTIQWRRTLTYFLCLPLVVTAVTAATGTSPAGLKFTLKMERRPIGGGPPAGLPALPSGAVEVEYVTDGRSVRATIHGQRADAADGTVTIAIAGTPGRYILDPSTHTYKTREVAHPQFEGPYEVDLHVTDRVATIEGFHARQVMIAYRNQNVEVPGSPVRFQLRAEVESWCTAELAVPPMLPNMSTTPVQFLGGRHTADYVRLCPFALRTFTRMSSDPGYELVSQIVAVQHVTPAPDLFRIPADYREAR